MKTNRLLIVCSMLLTFLCVWLGMENENLHRELKEETLMRYEYAIVIDSLMSERETEIEGMRHWQEEMETHYAPQWKQSK